MRTRYHPDRHRLESPRLAREQTRTRYHPDRHRLESPRPASAHTRTRYHPDRHHLESPRPAGGPRCEGYPRSRAFARIGPSQRPPPGLALSVHQEVDRSAWRACVDRREPPRAAVEPVEGFGVGSGVGPVVVEPVEGFGSGSSVSVGVGEPVEDISGVSFIGSIPTIHRRYPRVDVQWRLRGTPGPPSTTCRGGRRRRSAGRPSRR